MITINGISFGPTDLIYLSSPYTHPNNDVREQRTTEAGIAHACLLGLGVNTFAPIPHSERAAGGAPHLLGRDISHEEWMRLDLVMLERCTKLVVLRLDGWRESRGVKEEIDYAYVLGIPTHYLDLEDLKNAVTQLREAAI